MPDVGEAGEGYVAKLVKLLGKLDPPARVKVLRLPGLDDDGDDIEQFIESRPGGDGRGAAGRDRGPGRRSALRG